MTTRTLPLLACTVATNIGGNVRFDTAAQSEIGQRRAARMRELHKK